MKTEVTDDFPSGVQCGKQFKSRYSIVVQLLNFCLVAVDCSERVDVDFVWRLQGVIAGDAGLVYSAVTEDDVVMHVLPNVQKVRDLYREHEEDLMYAQAPSDIACHATYILRNNKVVDIIPDALDLTMSDDDDDNNVPASPKSSVTATAANTEINNSDAQQSSDTDGSP